MRRILFFLLVITALLCSCSEKSTETYSFIPIGEKMNAEEFAELLSVSTGYMEERAGIGEFGHAVIVNHDNSGNGIYISHDFGQTYTEYVLLNELKTVVPNAELVMFIGGNSNELEAVFKYELHGNIEYKQFSVIFYEMNGESIWKWEEDTADTWFIEMYKQNIQEGIKQFTSQRNLD